VCELRSVRLQSCPLACFSVSDVKHVGLLPGCQFSSLFCSLVVSWNSFGKSFAKLSVGRP
jgi:hypothetical protein